MSYPHLFGLGSPVTWLFAPDNYQELPIPVVGYNLRGEPVRQGYPSIVFTWSFMNQTHLTELLAEYNADDPQTAIQYISHTTGSLTSKYGMLEEPIIGARFITFYQGVALKVTRITETP